ncbi:hypothetical protein FACS189428_7800 [Clostridia bacterium]|nr:hypothetical protein FACS189428_7800 [Clostridia bacterium]
MFNKQYSREEYEKLVASIIEQMQMRKERGEFFHPSLSPFEYNETVANDLYPSNFEQVVSVGFNWSQYEAPQPTAERVMLGKDLPMRIEEVGEDILQAVIACEVSGKLFRIQPRELAFYRQLGIPLPKKHPDVRNEERLRRE